MKKLPANPTTAENLEGKFDRGDDVLDYFDMREAHVVVSRAEQAGAKSKSAYASKRGTSRRAAVAETAPPYRKKR
jgi:hypothetical protein